MENQESINYEYEGKTYTIVPSQPFGFLHIEGLEDLGRFTDYNKAEIAIKEYTHKNAEIKRKIKEKIED